MSQMASNDLRSDPVHDSDVTTKKPEVEYAITWGEKVEITDEFIAQICPADLANHVCAFDYVMPNGCDHNCEMLRLCEVYVAHCDYECPNTDGNDLPCPYVHGVPISCSSINHQLKVHLEKKALEELLGASWKATPVERKREEGSKNQAKDHFVCTMKMAGNDCTRGHDHQAARLESYALLQKHQHSGRILRGTETETFDEKMAREAEQKAIQARSTLTNETTPVPSEATSTLVVQNLAYATTEESLKSAFEQYGDVKRVSILKKEDGTSKGTGFVDFTKLEHAAKALNAMQAIQIDGRALKVKFKSDKATGGSKRCFSCGQDGHISRDCPSKGPGQGGGSGYDAGGVQSAEAGWADVGVDAAGGNGWAGEESKDQWDTPGFEPAQNATVTNEQW